MTPPRPILSDGKTWVQGFIFLRFPGRRVRPGSGAVAVALLCAQRGATFNLFHSFHFAWSSFTLSGLRGGEVFGFADIGGQVVEFRAGDGLSLDRRFGYRRCCRSGRV